MTLKPKTRDEVIDEITMGLHLRVVIIGGGINGIATFRELALQGVSVLLVERGDFVSGASSASSHMIHGGLRYLENGEFALVKESLRERNRLLDSAPHYVRPLPTTVPLENVFSGMLSAPLHFLTHKTSSSKPRGALLVKLGLTIYDTFAGWGRAVPRHHFYGRRKSREMLPRLNPTVKYTATYHDASVANPERLALDVLNDGLSQGPHADALNYMEVIGYEGDGSLTLRDALDGKTYNISAPVLVNASGPWSDLTNRALGIQSEFMGGTKGSHIVLDHPELVDACGGHEIFFENSDGRIVLIYPLANRVVVGTTDLRVDIETADIVCCEDEVDYFFDLIGRVFPDIDVNRSHIVFSYSGVRPLPQTADTNPGFISRDYRIESAWLGPANGASNDGVRLFTLVGGKWTTFRATGEHLSDAVLEELGETRVSSTAELVIGGGQNYPRTPTARQEWLDQHLSGLAADRREVLFERYGTRAAEVADFLREQLANDPLAERPIAGAGNALTHAELQYMLQFEQVHHVHDVLYRRTDLAFLGLVTNEIVEALGTLMGEFLGWSKVTRQSELKETRALLQRSRARIVPLPVDGPSQLISD